MDSRNMKRGRSNPRNEARARTTKKKAKEAVEKAEEVAAKVVEERKEGNEGVVAVEEMAELEEWGMGLWSGLDEEMSWATCWFPFWEMEANIGDAYDAFYGDVLWDYDIWGLKSSGNAPNP